MEPTKRRKLEAAGWKVSTTADFLQLSPDEVEIIEIRLSLSKSLKQDRKMRYISSIEEITREDIAVKLLKKGTMPLEEIADITGLSIKQIQELQLEQN